MSLPNTVKEYFSKNKDLAKQKVFSQEGWCSYLFQ
jgi:hypothetical protein